MKLRLAVANRTAQHFSNFVVLVALNVVQHEDEPLALVIIEDITEISTLKSIIPMCMQCRKIRNDEQYWQTVEQYFHEHIGVDFSHGICPDCIDKFRRS